MNKNESNHYVTIDLENFNLYVYPTMDFAEKVSNYNNIKCDNPYEMLKLLDSHAPFALPYMSLDALSKAGAFLIQRIIFNNKKETRLFNSLYEAAKYVSDSGISTSNINRILTSIDNNLNGKTKTSFGGKWYAEEIQVPLDSFDLVFLN